MRHLVFRLAVVPLLFTAACGRLADPSDASDAGDDAPSSNPDAPSNPDAISPDIVPPPDDHSDAPIEGDASSDLAFRDVVSEPLSDRVPDTTTDVPPLSCGRTSERAVFHVRFPNGTTDDCTWRPPADGGWKPDDIVRSIAGVVRGRPADAAGSAAFALEVPDRDGGASTTLVLEIDQPVPLAVPEGAFVEVAYEIAWGWACTSFLRVTNLPTLNGQKNPVSDVVKTYLLANDGLRAPKNQMASVGVIVETFPLGCMPDAGPGCSGGSADSYFFRFSQQGQPSLDVLMGQTLPWKLGAQDVVVKNLQSFVTGACDDYWDWGFVFVGK